MTLEQARRVGAPRAIAMCQSFAGTVEMQAGHWTDAEVALRESSKIARQIGSGAIEALANQCLGLMLTAQGRLEAGLEILEDGLVAAKHATIRAHLMGRLYAAISRNRLAAGDLAAADLALAEGLARTENHGHCTTCESLLLPVGVSLRIAQGNLAAARTYYDQLKAATERYGSRTWLAKASQAQAELAEAEGDINQAITAYQEACEGFNAAHNEYEAVQCQAAMERLRQKVG